MAVGAVYPKLHHGTDYNQATIAALDGGWHLAWRELGVAVVGWGWVEGDPRAEAEIAVGLCEDYDLDGYIANAEAPYEGSDNYWKSGAFTQRFRDWAPKAPLGLSYIGFGNPQRDMLFQPWVDAGAAFLPQCYEGDASISISPALWSAANAGIPSDRIFPTLGTSSFSSLYPPATYGTELKAVGIGGYSVWLLDSTTDDTLRAIRAGQ